MFEVIKNLDGLDGVKRFPIVEQEVNHREKVREDIQRCKTVPEYAECQKYHEPLS